MINKASSADVSAIEKIENQCFSHPWSKESINTIISDKNSIVLAYNLNNNVVGYIGANCILDECYITNVAVLSQYRKNKVGTTLLNSLIEICTSKNFSFITLEVRKSNIPAIKLYEKLGFKKVGERKDYYTEPKENALLLTLYLN